MNKLLLTPYAQSIKLSFDKYINIKIIFSLILLWSGLEFNANSQSSFKLIDPLEAVYPDKNDLAKYGNSYKADFPLNTCADVIVLIKTKINIPISISATLDNNVLPITCFSELIEIPVERNTGIDSRTEVYLNKTNPYVIRKAPFKVFEAIKPLDKLEITSRNEYTAFRLQINKNYLTKAGKYICKINVKTENNRYEGAFKINVYNINVPDLISQKFLYTNWFNLVQMEQRHNVKRWSDEWYVMLNKYAELMADGRQNCINIPSELLSYKDNHITLDEVSLLKFINVFRKYGFQYFESPHIMYRGDNDDWGDPELKVCLTKNKYSTLEAKKDVDTIVKLIKDFTSNNNLKDCWLQHISDEPTKIQAKCYKEVVSQVKKIYPEVKIMEATNDRDSLIGAIDYWCPLINDFQENNQFFTDRVNAGEKVLIYTCLIPGGKWLNRTLDMEHLRQVYFGWATAKYNTIGYLHWGLNQYCVQNPFEQSVVHHPAPGAAANNELPAGDTHIIFPELDKPISSLRFEAHRLGIEDFELLNILKYKNNKLYNKLMNKLFRNFTDYEISDFKYRKVRKVLLKSLSDQYRRPL